MVMGGGLDTTAPFEENQRLVFSLLVPPRFLVEIEQAGHSNFANHCQLAFADCVPGDTPIHELHRLVVRHARGFLGSFAARDIRWETLLVPVPGAVLEADP